MDWMDYINTVISYALIIPGAIICMFPVRKHLRIPKKILFLEKRKKQNKNDISDTFPNFISKFDSL